MTTKMTLQEARQVLGLFPTDEVEKQGLEDLRTAEVRLLEVTSNEVEQQSCKLWIKAIDTMLKFRDYAIA